MFFSVLSGDSIRNEQAGADCFMASGLLSLIELEMYYLALLHLTFFFFFEGLLHLTWDDQADASVLQRRRYGEEWRRRIMRYALRSLTEN